MAQEILKPGLGTMRILVGYYSSRKAQPVTIYLTAKKGAEDYGSSAVGIFQRPGPVAQSFFTVNPPRIAVNTLAGSEPIEAQLIATSTTPTITLSLTSAFPLPLNL